MTTPDPKPGDLRALAERLRENAVRFSLPVQVDMLSAADMLDRLASPTKLTNELVDDPNSASGKSLRPVVALKQSHAGQGICPACGKDLASPAPKPVHIIGPNTFNGYNSKGQTNELAVPDYAVPELSDISLSPARVALWFKSWEDAKEFVSVLASP